MERYIEDIIEDLNCFKSKSSYSRKELCIIHDLSVELKNKCEKALGITQE